MARRAVDRELFLSSSFSFRISFSRADSAKVLPSGVFFFTRLQDESVLRLCQYQYSASHTVCLFYEAAFSASFFSRNIAGGHSSSRKRANSFSIVILHESPNFNFHLFNRHFLCFQLTDFFFLQRGENALSSAVVKAASDSAHALNQAVFPKQLETLRLCTDSPRHCGKSRLKRAFCHEKRHQELKHRGKPADFSP